MYIRVLTALVLLSAFATAATDPKIPPISGMTSFGCDIAPASDHKGWRAYGWAEHDEHRDWRKLLSVRSGKNARRKCLTDCDSWMRQVDSAVQPRTNSLSYAWQR